MRTFQARTRLNRVVVAALGMSMLSPLGCSHEPSGPVLSGGREIKSWIADLRDRNPKVRRQAVLKLGNAGDSDPAVAEGLAEALDDSDAVVRRDAIRAVAKFKSMTSSISEKLEKMSREDKDTIARDLATKLLARGGSSQ
jgi:hypothetical protein